MTLLLPQPDTTVAREVIPSCLLTVYVALAQHHLLLLNVYAPTDGQDKVIFLETLATLLHNAIQSNDLLLIGRDLTSPLTSCLITRSLSLTYP